MSNFYIYYPIKCETCNEKIATHAKEYNELKLQNLSNEEALNKIGLINPCSRIAMENPIVTYYNIQNNELVKGIKDLDDIYSPTIYENNNKDLFKGTSVDINLNKNKFKEFEYPTQVGIPTFNYNPFYPSEFKDVGAGYDVEMIIGRTYLAR